MRTSSTFIPGAPIRANEYTMVGLQNGVDSGGPPAARAAHASACRDVTSGGCRRTPFLRSPRAVELGSMMSLPFALPPFKGS